MARYFIGENGFYPSWAKGNGRWVLQRVLTTGGLGGLITQIDNLAKPSVANEALIWVPPNGLRRLFQTGGREATRALLELMNTPLICEKSDWSKDWSTFTPSFEIKPDDHGPRDWRVRCPLCHSLVGPNLFNLSPERIIERWKAKGKPALDDPSAASLIANSNPIKDLEEWIQKFKPMKTELAYVGQQLWANLSDFISATSPPRTNP